MDCNNKNIFPGQKPDEKIEFFVRRHWVSYLPNIPIALIMIVLPIVVIVGIVSFFHIDLNQTLNHYIILAISAFILFVMTFFIVGWVDYYFDVLILTDERLVNIEQNGLFNRHISELDLLRVQNVSTSIKGVVPTFFDYGVVVVQTAGEHNLGASSRTSDFVMEAMPDPNKIAQQIMHLHQQLVTKRGQVKATTYGEGEIHLGSPLEQSSGDPEDNSPEPIGESMQTIDNSEISEIVDEKIEPPESQPEPPPSPKERNSLPPKNLSHHPTDEGQLKEGETIDL